MSNFKRLLILSWICLGMSPARSVSAQEMFVERAQELGIHHTSLAGFDEVGTLGEISDWTQTGAVIGDIDNDGDPDLVLCGGIHKNTVLRNDGVKFTDITAQSGVEVGEFDRAAALGDYDNDGDLDLYMCALSSGIGASEGRNRLYQNNGAGVFADVTDLAGARGAGQSIFAQWFDLNRDGLLDLLVSEFLVSPNLYYQNNGDGTFTELGASMGLNWGGSTHVTAILDSDGDGGLDVFAGNDWLVSWIVGLPGNLGDGQVSCPVPEGSAPFVDVSGGSGQNVERGIMGFAFGDLDYDGDLDLYKTDIGENFYFENRGWPASGVPWLERQQDFGISSGLSPDPAVPGTSKLNSSWGAIFFHADADRMQDLLVVNGHVAGMVPGKSHLARDEPNDLYWGVAPSTPMLKDDGSAGLGAPIDDRGLAVGDMDRDGDLDLVITATAGPARYYENRIPRHGMGWFQVVPETHTSAPGGLGTVVTWTDSMGLIHTRSIGSDGPTASQHEAIAHFGMGTDPEAAVFVKFQSGIELGPIAVPKNTRLVAVEPRLFELVPSILKTASSAGPGHDRLTVNVLAHTNNGTPLDATASVQIDVPGLVALGPVSHVQANHFQRQFALSPTPGAFPVTIRFNGWRPSVVPRALFRGTLDGTATEVALHPPAIRAGTNDQVEIVVAPKDAAGLSLGPGQTVSIQVPGLTAAGPVVDHGDGSYRATFAAPAQAGMLSPLVSVGGVPLTGLPPLEVAASADLAMTEVSLQVPMPFHSASPNELRIRVTPRDAQGNRLGPAAKVFMAFTLDKPTGPAPHKQRSKVTTPPPAGLSGQGPTASTPPGQRPMGAPIQRKVSPRRDPFEGGQADGEFHFILAKTPGQPSYLPSGTITITIDGLALAPIPFSF